MKPERQYQLALKYIHGIGSKTSKDLLSYCGSAEAIFKATKGKLAKIPGFGEISAAVVIKHRKLALIKAEKELLAMEGRNVNLTFFTDDDYPRRLRHLYDSPPLLYYRGQNNFNQGKVISIVGTRKATDYGKEVVQDLVAGLAKFKPVIVSGLAYGIDIEAHRAALGNQLPTWAIIAGGLNKIYPPSHQKYLPTILKTGSLVTEYPLDTEPVATHFPERNRIIAGISDVTIVVEAAVKGGALITAEIANSYNKDVFAVPGSVTSQFSEGCNNLIKDNKAHLLTSADDIPNLLRWDAEEQSSSAAVMDLESFSKEEVAVLQLLQSEAMQIDELSWRLNVPVNNLASILLNLEFQGVLNSLPGKKYKLKSNRLSQS